MVDQTMEAAHGTKPQKAPMKFSLSKSKPSLSRPPPFPKDDGKAVDEQEAVEFVTEFDGKGMKVRGSETRVIPKLENSWRPEKRMKNIRMESDSSELTENRFEIETLSAGPKPDVLYGLTILSKKPDASQEDQQGSTVEALGDSEVENSAGRYAIGNSLETKPSRAQLEEQKRREDLQALPDEASFDAYNSMPVEDFGEALLRGMGWEKGKPIGRSSKTAVSPVEFVKRVGREGLGAVPAPKPEKSQRYLKPGETRAAKPDVKAPIGRDERPSTNERISEKLGEGAGAITIGNVMSIVRGPHAGSRGEVIDKRKPDGRSSERVYMRLLEKGEMVRVRSDEVAEIGSLQEENARKQIVDLKIVDSEEAKKDHRFDSRRDRSEMGQRKEDQVEDIEKRAGRTRDLRRGERRDRDITDFDTSERPSDRRRETKVEKPRNQDTFERYDRKRGDEVKLGDDFDSKRTQPDGYRYHERQTSPLDDKRGRREEGRKKETQRREAVLSLKEEGSCRELKTELEGVPITGKDMGISRASSQNKDKYHDDSHRSWLRSGIRVRIISKTLQSGALYLKKAHVVDVSGPKTCDIVLDDNGLLIEEVKKEQLETALPKRGGRVIVVGGKHKGLIGKLLERDSQKETALVQTEEDFEMLTLKLDDVAEFVRDPLEVDL